MKFFRVASLHSAYMLAGLIALGIYGVCTLALHPTAGVDVVVPVMLLDMFAVSSGFAVPARRGHFDLLLTAGCRRLSVAIVHWAMSIAPGAGIWVLLGVTEWTLTGHPRTVFANGSVAAFALISTMAWAVTVPMPRLSGGVLWLVALFVVLAASGDWRHSMLTLLEHSGAGMHFGVAFLVCPLFVIGTQLDGPQLMALLPGIAAGAAAMIAAIAWICRMDICLEAAQ